MNDGAPLVLGPHHHAIKVSDLASAEAFYAGVLGLPVVRRWTYPPGAARAGLRSLWLGLAGPAGESPFLALERADDPPVVAARAGEVAGHFLLALRIGPEAREDWRRHLTAAGFPVTHETPFTLYVRDPEGNRVGLSHHPAAARAAEHGPDASSTTGENVATGPTHAPERRG